MSVRDRWPDRAGFCTEAAVVVGAVVPGLLLQPSTDPRATAWTVLVAADAAVVALLPWRHRRPSLTLWSVAAVLVAAYLVAALGGSRLAPQAVLPGRPAPTTHFTMSCRPPEPVAALPA